MVGGDGTKTFWNQTVVLKPSMNRHSPVNILKITEKYALRSSTLWHANHISIKLLFFKSHKNLCIRFHGRRKFLERSPRNTTVVPSGDLGEGGSLTFYLPCHLVFFCSESTIVPGWRTDLKSPQRAVLRMGPWQCPRHPPTQGELAPRGPSRACCEALFVRREAQ